MSLISRPHTLQRYLTFTRRISPAGGGGGSAVDMLRRMPVPANHKKKNKMTAPSHHTMVEKSTASTT